MTKIVILLVCLSIVPFRFALAGISCEQVLEQETALAPSALKAKVLSFERITENTGLLRVEKPPGFDFKPGEAVRITLETSQGPQSKFLSMANSPIEDHLEFAVRLSGSDFKNAFLSLAPGTDIELSAPKGALKFNPELPAVMIAGGIGITPFRSITQFVLDQKLPTPLHLLYSNRTPEEIAFKREFDELAMAKPQLKVSYVVSEPTAAWLGSSGRIDKDYLLQMLPNFPPSAIFYVVGPPAMALGIKAALTQLGVSPDRICLELFPGYK